jgi:hypothetical protein
VRSFNDFCRMHLTHQKKRSRTAYHSEYSGECGDGAARRTQLYDLVVRSPCPRN